MNDRALLSRLTSSVTGCALAGQVFLALNSRSRRKPEREGRGDLIRRAVTLTLAMCLLLSSGIVHGGLAKTKSSVEVLTAQYSLNEDLEDADGAKLRRKLLKLLTRADIRLFLSVIKEAEGGEPNLMVGGCRATTLSLHPALTLPSRCWYRVLGWGHSTASGNYQLTYSNWKEIAPFLGLRDFSEISQALAALELIRRGGGAAKATTASGLAVKARVQAGFIKLLRGQLKSALCLATYDWASSTCSPFPASTKINYAKLAETVRRKQTGPQSKDRCVAATHRRAAVCCRETSGGLPDSMTGGARRLSHNSDE